METVNPYSPPEGKLSDESGEYGTIKMFSAKGRIGRLRYLGYSMGIGLLVMLLMVMLIAGASFVLPASLLPSTKALIYALIYALGCGVIVVINVLLTIQRCHDFNVTGWLSLILLIPIAPIVFWFIPGSQGGNDYGAQPPPNSGVLIILMVSFILLIGILAAVAIPTYQEYLLRVQEMQG